MNDITLENVFRSEAHESLGFLLWQVTQLWQQTIGQVLADFGITQTQFAILASLLWFEQQGVSISQAQLAVHSKIEKMTLSKAIRKLEHQAWLVREDSAIDNRAFSVKLTDTGRQLAKQSAIKVECADAQFFEQLSDVQQQQFLPIMQKLLPN